MRKMKDSGVEWIGKIPEEWKALSAKYMVNISNGRDPVKEGNIPVYGSGANSYKTCGEYKEGPAVLVGRKGTIEIPRYIESKYWNIDTAFDVHAYKHGISLKYYYYLAVCFDYKFYLTQTALPSMTQTDYGNMVIPAPDNSDSIAEYLDSKCSKIDGLVSDIEKQITTLEQYKRSVITEAVTKGLDQAVPMKDSGIEWIGQIPEEWVVSPLKYNFIVYSGATPKTEISDYWDGDITWITPADYKTTDIYISTGNRFLTRRGLNSCGTTVVPVGSIIFSKRAPVGTVAINNIPLCTNQGCLSCVPIKGTNSKFYYYLMSILTEQYELVSSGTTFKEISSVSFSNYKLPNPPTLEQCCIADYLDTKCSEIDSAISLKKQQIKTLIDHKKSLIYEYVTGKKEIPA